MTMMSSAPYARMRASGTTRSSSGAPIKMIEPSTAPSGEFMPPSTMIVRMSNDMFELKIVGSMYVYWCASREPASPDGIGERLVCAGAHADRLTRLLVGADRVEHMAQMGALDAHDDHERGDEHRHVEQIDLLRRVEWTAENGGERNAGDAQGPVRERLGHADQRDHDGAEADRGDGHVMPRELPRGEGQYARADGGDDAGAEQRHEERPVHLRRQQRRGVGAERDRPGEAQDRLAGGTGDERETHGGDRIHRDLRADAGEVIAEDERCGERGEREHEIAPPWQADRACVGEERAGHRLGCDVRGGAKQALRPGDEDDEQRTEGDEVVRAVTEPEHTQCLDDAQHEATDHGAGNGAETTDRRGDERRKPDRAAVHGVDVGIEPADEDAGAEDVAAALGAAAGLP